MNSRNFREAIGLPQRFLADWIGTSRDLLAQAEIGKREIPFKSRQIFYQLSDILNNLPDAEPEFQKPFTDEKLVRKLQQKIRLLRHQIQLEEYKIIDLKALMAKQKRAILFCQTLEKREFFIEVLAQKVLDLFLYKTCLNYEKSGPRKLKKMEFYLNQKKEECAFLENWVQDFQ